VRLNVTDFGGELEFDPYDATKLYITAKGESYKTFGAIYRINLSGSRPV